MDMVRLSVPGTLEYRAIVLRVVASVCSLLRSRFEKEQKASHADLVETGDKVVSAVGEAFNNIAIHAYGSSATGDVRLELDFDSLVLTIRLLDTGKGFDFSNETTEDRETLRESHMGLVIIESCMDEVTYNRGENASPNVLLMRKDYFAGARRSAAARPK